MRQNIWMSVALALSLAAAGCANSKKEEPGQAGQAASNGPAWTLTLKSACLDAESDQCVGKYGFAVSADGSYKVGPSATQAALEGKLTDAELSDLSAKLKDAVATLATGTQADESGVEFESDDTLTLVRQDKTQVVASNTADLFHFATRSLAEAKALHDAIRDLAKSYYRLPYGNDCGKAILAFEAQYSDLQGCEQDSDCVYVNAGFGPAYGPQYLLKDDCTVVKPMLVANRLKLDGKTLELRDAYVDAVNTCGGAGAIQKGHYGIACQLTYASTSTSARCVQNRCQPAF